jgi:hypothetical protein
MRENRGAILGIMRSLLAGLLTCVFFGFAAAQPNIRQVDFKNFTYPWSRSSGWPHQLQWLDTSEHERVQLVNGRWHDTEDADDSGKSGPFSGLTYEDVQFADVTGDGQTDAVVVLRFDTGGTQYSHYVYIYSSVAGKPKLLAHFHSGDRAASGLYRVYGEGGKLVVELFDPEKRSGDCCSSGFIRTRYRWQNGTFKAFGTQESGTSKSPSRLPVSVFGTHK